MNMRIVDRIMLWLGLAFVGGFALVLVYLFVFVPIMMGIFDSDPTSPFVKDHICFARDLPGATSRFAVYTPVRCSDMTSQMGESVGADYAFIRFEDVDKDGVDEAIVESSWMRCTFGGSSCSDAYQYILKITPGQDPAVRVVKQTYLEDLSDHADRVK